MRKYKEYCLEEGRLKRFLWADGCVGVGGYCRATFVADGGRKSKAVCGHFPDQILIDPTARNKALLKHNPLSGITG